MLMIIESPDGTGEAVSDAIVANFLGLSALDLNKPIIGSSGAIPFLVKTLKILDGEKNVGFKQDRMLFELFIIYPFPHQTFPSFWKLI